MVVDITDDLDELLAFYDFPAEHWKHLHTTNAIESILATVRLRQRVTKGPGAAPAAPRWDFMQTAQQRWRRVSGHERVALVRASATFIDDQLQGRPDEPEGC